MQQHTPLPKDLTTLAIDLAKDTFQIAGENQQQRIVYEQRIKGRATFARLLKQIPTHITVLMETGPGAQHYARTLKTQGNPVRILPAFHVSRHRHGGKNDRNDTLAILRAGRDQSIHPVPIKTPEQSALRTLHNIRRRHISNRTALGNQLRAILLEHNIAVATGHQALDRTLDEIIANNTLPTLTDLLILLHQEWQHHGQRIDTLGQQLQRHAQQNPTCQRLMTIPGIGPITATALIAKNLDPKRFQSARHLAAYFGIVPEQHSSGDKIRLGRMNRRGDPHIRSLLIEGAHAVLRQLKSGSLEHDQQRLQRWQKRHGNKGAAIRLANHNLRIIWRLLTDDLDYRRNHRNPRPIDAAEQAPQQTTGETATNAA